MNCLSHISRVSTLRPMIGGNDFAYATLRVGGTVGLYAINLTTGAAALVGSVLGNPPIIGLAIEPDFIFHDGFD